MATSKTRFDTRDSSAPTHPRVERRCGNRYSLQFRILVQPSAFLPDDFEEVCTTVNVARDGLYFLSRSGSYRRGMQLIVIWPHSTLPEGPRFENIGKVLRVDPFTNSLRGVAVQLVQPILS